MKFTLCKTILQNIGDIGRNKSTNLDRILHDYWILRSRRKSVNEKLMSELIHSEDLKQETENIFVRAQELNKVQLTIL